MKDSRRNQRALAIAKQCWTGVILLALGLYVWKNGAHIAMTLAAIPKNHLIAAFLCIVAGKLSALSLMRASLRMLMPAPPSWRVSSWIYASSDVAKYMPGGVGHRRPSGALQESEPVGCLHLKALLLENLGFGVTALALGTPVAVAMALKAGWLSGMGWSAVAMVVIAMIWAGSRLLVRRGVAISRLNAGIGSVALMVMTLGWVAMGTSFSYCWLHLEAGLTGYGLSERMPWPLPPAWSPYLRLRGPVCVRGFDAGRANAWSFRRYDAGCGFAEPCSLGRG
ncbi:hypothetical protein WJ967_05155 [Achromobacter xylosoxidans]